jgi:hypothetical protein
LSKDGIVNGQVSRYGGVSGSLEFDSRQIVSGMTAFS